MATENQQRTNTGWLEPLERPTLAALVTRLPGWITPDIMTGIGFGGSLIMFGAYTFSSINSFWLWVASFGLVVNWLGDSLDGNLARYRKIERPRYGYFLDQATDLIMQFLLAAGIAFSGFVRGDIIFAALSIFLMLSVLTLLRQNINGIFQLSYGGFGYTELRAMLIMLNVLIYFFPPHALTLLSLEMTYPNWLLVIWCLVSMATFILGMLSDLRRLAIEDPPRTR